MLKGYNRVLETNEGDTRKSSRNSTREILNAGF